MGKVKKSTIKYLKKEGKATKPGGKGPTPKGRSKPKKSSDDDLGDVKAAERQAINLRKPSSVKGEKGSIKQHQSELEALQDADPEFFEFLSKNDNTLLNFGQHDGDSDDDDGEDDESDLEDDLVGGDSDDDDSDAEDNDSDDEEEQQTSSKKGKGRAVKSLAKIIVTSDMLNQSIKKAKTGSMVELKKLLSMFRSACMPGDDEDDDTEKGSSRFVIQSSDIYEAVMNGVISSLYSIFKLHLEVKTSSKAALAALSKHPKWKRMQLLVLSFFKSMLHTLDSLAENTSTTKQKDVLVYLLTCLEKYIPFLAPLPRLAKGVIKVLLNIWCIVPLEVEEANNAVVILTRSHAFLRIRQMALVLPGAIAEECFRAMYLKFARSNRSFNELNASSVTFMAQCIAELYTSDPAMAYQQSFLYIRQLALYLRSAVLKKTAENTRQITSWQFVNCLRLWTRVICLMPDFDRGLGALVFPLSQIMFGVIATVPSVYFVPLHFHLISCLNQLAAASQRFIPTSARVIELLSAVDFSAKATGSTAVPPHLSYLVKLPTGSLDTVTTREAVFTEALNLIRQDAEVYRFHVGVPEYLYMTIRKLRALAKTLKVANWRSMLHNLIGQLDEFSAFARRERVKLNVAPMSITTFEPLMEFVQQQAAATKKKQKTSNSNINGSEAIEPALIRLNKLISRNKMFGSSNLAGAAAAVIPSSAESAEQLKSTVSLRDNFANSKKRKQAQSSTKKKGGGNSEEDEDDDGDDDDGGGDDNQSESDEDNGNSEEPEEYSDDDDDEEEKNDSDDDDEDDDEEDVGGLVDKSSLAELKDTVGNLNWDDDDDE